MSATAMTIDSETVHEHLSRLSGLIDDMNTILSDGAEDAPLAFFEACEEAQFEVTKLMRSAFLAVQIKPAAS